MLFLLACTDVPSPGKGDSAWLDLSARLGPDEARAGRVTEAGELFGGVSAEGAPGDWKIYNDRVRFVIQDVGDSSYYVEEGGALIDADVVRADGEPGRDMLDELAVMAGLARVVHAESVTVLSDGADGEAAIRVEGVGTPMTLATGALENPDLVADLDLAIRTDYTLPAGSWAMRVETTVRNDEDEPVTVQIGAGGIIAQEVGTTWAKGHGFEPETDADVDVSALVADRGEGVLALVGDGGPLGTGAVGRILGALAPMVLGFGDDVTLAPGESATWAMWVAAAPDLATIEAERLARAGAQAQTLSGTVRAGGEPVAGARVHVLDGGAPVTIATTDASGRWSATVAAEVSPTFVATGRGNAVHFDLPAGAGWYAPYEADVAATLTTLAEGAVAGEFAEGYGVGEATSDPTLTLKRPGALAVRVADGGPAVVRVEFAEGDAVAGDDRLYPGRPSGAAAIAFVRDGAIEVPVEAGTYDVVVHRGVRDNVVVQRVTLDPGGRAEVLADVRAAYTLEGVLTVDPHSHASPSGDGDVTMEGRLLASAGNGVDVHVGTDHDHVADYRTLLYTLGLDGWMHSIVADEVSPVLRGHFNMYPASPGTSANGGSPRWWLGYRDTDEIVGWMRARVGPTGIVQANHPYGDSGMFKFAQYDLASGAIGARDRWSDGFDAVEVLNRGDHEEYLPYFLDLVSRGEDKIPVGVSDSHSATDGSLGVSLTFLETGTDLAGFGPEVLVAAMRAGRTVASRGPYVDARMGGERVIGTTVAPGSLDVTVYAPDWMPVETVSLVQDGEVVATAACAGEAPTPCATSFELSPAADASYVVVAESTTQPMVWAHAGTYAWAVTNAVKVDVAGDGWTAPRSPLIK
ncbi:MAG: CehA/McbA family metallohydrolase [Myxococcota bacterium]